MSSTLVERSTLNTAAENAALILGAMVETAMYRTTLNRAPMWFAADAATLGYALAQASDVPDFWDLRDTDLPDYETVCYQLSEFLGLAGALSAAAAEAVVAQALAGFLPPHPERLFTVLPPTGSDSFETWFDEFQPEINLIAEVAPTEVRDEAIPFNGTYFETSGPELDYVRQQPDNQVWTYITSNESSTGMFLSDLEQVVPGFILKERLGEDMGDGYRVLKAFGYFVCAKPWDAMHAALAIPIED